MGLHFVQNLKQLKDAVVEQTNYYSKKSICLVFLLNCIHNFSGDNTTCALPGEELNDITTELHACIYSKTSCYVLT